MAWLADYVGFQSELVYIKGAKEKWYVFAKTAPKHQPTNIAGNHGNNYGCEQRFLLIPDLKARAIVNYQRVHLRDWRLIQQRVSESIQPYIINSQ